MTTIQYRHPTNPALTWTGKGRQPTWVEFAIANGFSLADLAIENQRTADAPQKPEIDLGIGEAAAHTPEPTLAETLYAQRIAVGHSPMPDEKDKSFTPGTRQALAVIEAKTPAIPSEVVDKALPSSDAEGRDLINQLLGQAQAFAAASGLLQTFGVSKLAYVKENGLYKHMAGMRAPNGLEFGGTWVEFCGLLGISDEKANQDIANLRAFGEEALESMNRMGIGYRELRQFRKLPPDQREALAQIAKTGNKDDVLEAAYEAIEAERAKRGELEGKAAELAEDLKLAERRSKNLDAEIERQALQLKRLTEAKRRATTFLDRTEDVREECLALQKGGELHLMSLQRLFDETEIAAPEGQLQAETLWITANTLAARALDLVEHIRARSPEGLPQRPTGEHVLTLAEARDWLLNYPLIENRHAAEEALRQEKREAARPRGPGRPKGSGNKEA
ncbi:MAG: H-NS histone family protein [Azonexus sp.]|jgi:hypothetical protein|nr:H-NS histone family protein [Azonexus sp.]